MIDSYSLYFSLTEVVAQSVAAKHTTVSLLTLLSEVFFRLI